MTNNYFTLLAVTSDFNLDLQALEAAYFKAQRQYHPDRFVGKPENERQQALQRSVDINNAYHTLKDPLKRAQYLLREQGIMVGTENDSLKPSPDLLMDVMEWREETAEAQTKEQLDAQDHALDQRFTMAIADISTAYDKKDWPFMAKQVLRLGYIMKTREELVLHRIRLKASKAS